MGQGGEGDPQVFLIILYDVGARGVEITGLVINRKPKGGKVQYYSDETVCQFFPA